jgi:hypothetical protein
VGRPAITRATESSQRFSIGGEEDVGDAGQALARLLIPRGHRLLGEVARGHHQRSAHGGKEQVVERGVGQHQTHEGIPRGHVRGEARALPAPHQDDGALDRGEEAALLRV